MDGFQHPVSLYCLALEVAPSHWLDRQGIDTGLKRSPYAKIRHRLRWKRNYRPYPFSQLVVPDFDSRAGAFGNNRDFQEVVHKVIPGRFVFAIESRDETLINVATDLRRLIEEKLAKIDVVKNRMWATPEKVFDRIVDADRATENFQAYPAPKHLVLAEY